MFKKIVFFSMVVLLTVYSDLYAAEASDKDRYTRAAYDHAEELIKVLIKLQMVAGSDAELRRWAMHAAHMAAEIAEVASRHLSGDSTELEHRLKIYESRSQAEQAERAERAKRMAEQVWWAEERK